MTLSFSDEQVEKFLDALKKYECPRCSARLFTDDQRDSVYVSCKKDYHHFRISGFKDLYSGNLVLLYFNDEGEGIINMQLLEKFQKVMYRRIPRNF
ncbi:MAG: hypothetical protein ACTSYC_10115 [Promethearchaeota archaeon]